MFIRISIVSLLLACLLVAAQCGGMSKSGRTAQGGKGACSILSGGKAAPAGKGGEWMAPRGAVPILAASDGGYLAGVNMSDAVMVVWTDLDGNIRWRHSYPEFSSLSCIQADPGGGGYVLAGIVSSGGPHGQSDEDAVVMGIDSTGKRVWAETYSGGAMETDDSGHYWSYEDDGADAILAVPDGGFVFAGHTGAKSESEKAAWVVRIDAKGKVLWSRVCGGTEALSIAPDPAGGWVVAGYIVPEDGGEADSWAAKLDGQGIVVWEKTYGEKGYDAALSIVSAPQGGGYVAAGYAAQKAGEGPGEGAELRDARAMKIDEDGSVLWDRHHGGDGIDLFSSIGAVAGAGYIAAGFTTSRGAGGMDAWVVRLDEKGSVTSEKPYGGAGDDEARSIRAAPDGSSVFSGGTGDDAWLVKLDAGGGVQWDRILVEKQDYWAASVQVDAVGGYVAAGTAMAGPGGDVDAWVAKIDSKGRILWGRTYGRGGADGASSVRPDRDGGYIVAGSTQSPLPGDPQIMQGDAWVVKLDPEGNVLWDKAYGGAGEDGARAILAVKAGGYVVAGFSASAGAAATDCPLCVYPDHAWVLRLDALGGVLWEKTYEVMSTACGIDTAPGDAYVLAGYGDYEAPDGRTDRDAAVVKVTEGGNVVWARGYYANEGIYKSEEFYSIQSAGDDGYAAAGYTASKGAGESDAWVVRIDADGKILWDRVMGGPGMDEAYGVQAAAGGGFIAAGYKEVGAGGGEGDRRSSLWVVSLDSKGRVKWEKSHGGIGDEEEANVLQATPDGGFIIAGYRQDVQNPQRYGGARDAWIAKYDSRGDSTWNLVYGGPLADCVINP